MVIDEDILLCVQRVCVTCWCHLDRSQVLEGPLDHLHNAVFNWNQMWLCLVSWWDIHQFASRFTWTFRKLLGLVLALFIHGLKSGIMGNVHLKMCPQNNVQKSPSFCQTFEFQNISLEVSSFLSFFYIYFLHIKKYLWEWNGYDYLWSIFPQMTDYKLDVLHH